MVVQKINTFGIQKQRLISDGPGSKIFMEGIGFTWVLKTGGAHIPAEVREGLSQMGVGLSKGGEAGMCRVCQEVLINLWLDSVLCEGVSLGKAWNTKQPL